MKVKHQARIIKKLRNEIPQSQFICKKGCIKCCGPVPWVFWEKKQIQSIINISELDQQKTIISNEGVSCPYCDQDIGCLIYDERPILCRIFGISEDKRIKCPKNNKMPPLLSIYQTKLIMNKYMDLKPKLMLEKALFNITGKKYVSYIDKYWG